MKLILGIPDGSMVDPKRGGLKKILDESGIYIKNLGASKPLEVENIPWLEAREARPQELPSLAKYGYCDVFFCGDDWAKEWELRGIKNDKLLGLGIGKVDIVDARKENTYKDLIWASEYPFISQDYFGGKKNAKIVNIGDNIPSRDSLAKTGKVVILYSWGKTESKAYYGLVDGIIEVSQSGRSIKNYNMKVIDKVMTSECSLYVPLEIPEQKKPYIAKLESLLKKVVGV